MALAAASFVTQCYGAFSVYRDLHSSPMFTVNDNPDSYLLEDQVQAFISSVSAQDNVEVEIMKHDNKTFVCTLPVTPEPLTESENTVDLVQWNETELAQAKSDAVKRLSVLKDTCIHHRISWFTYTFCYDREVSQYHAEGSLLQTHERPIPSDDVMFFYLGKFTHKPNGDANYKTRVKFDGDRNYLSYSLNGGTLCDLTGRNRSVEVQFYCYPDVPDSILYIKEIRSCEYQLGIATNKLCSNPVFAGPEKEEALKVECQQVLQSSDIASWKERSTPSVPYATPKVHIHGTSAPIVSFKTEFSKSELAAAAATDSSGATNLPAKYALEKSANNIYDDLDFTTSGPLKRIALTDKELEGVKLKTYLDDTDFALSLIMKKVSTMIRAGQIKNAEGKSVRAKDSFTAIAELLDLDKTSVLNVRIVLHDGELLIHILHGDDLKTGEETEEEEYGDEEEGEEDSDEEEDQETSTSTVTFVATYTQTPRDHDEL